MDHVRILERAVDTVRRHRALWILGFLLALVGGGSAGNWGGAGNGINFQAEQGDLARWQGQVPEPLASIDPRTLIAAAVLACGVLLLLAILLTIARYVLQVGIFRSLDRLDREGVRPTVRGAWREGWHRRTWRPFLQNLIVGIAVVIGVILLLLPVPAPLLLLAADDAGVKVLGVVLTVGLFIAWVFVIIGVAVVIGVLQQLWWRAAVLDDQGFLYAIGTGWRLARRNIGNLGIMWLLMVGAGILWAVVSFVLLLIFGGITGLVAVAPAYLWWKSSQMLLWPVIYGLSVSVVTLAIPIIFVSGLYLVFKASVWTQVYRELAGEPPTAVEHEATPDALSPAGAAA